MIHGAPLSTRACALVLVALAACHDHDHGHDHDHDDHSPAVVDAAPITNRVQIPAPVRQSLGITFAKAELRRVEETVRLAGSVDAQPAARRPFHANVPGTVTVHVSPFEAVEAGQLLVSVVSPELLEFRHHLHVAADGVGIAEDELRIESQLLREASASLRIAKERLARIRGAGASKADLSADVSRLEQRVGVLRVKVSAKKRALVRAEHRFEAELAAFATRVGMSVADLQGEGSEDPDHGDVVPPWEHLTRLELRASFAGVVSNLPVRTGAWVERGGLVAEVTNPTALWVVGRALASDVARLANGQRVTIAPSGLPGTEATKAVEGTLRVGVAGDDKRLTFPVFVELDEVAAWMRPGVTVFALVAVGGASEPELAVPMDALVRDGLETVFFRRDPADPDKAIRTVADLGPRDGRWAVVYSGVVPGDDIVIDGAYELKLASTAEPNVVGHFHADGTFHEGED